MIPYNFLKLKQDEIPNLRVGEYVFIQERIYLYLKPLEEYSLYFYLNKPSDDLTFTIVNGNKEELYLITPKVVSKGNYIYVTFSFPATVSDSPYSDEYDEEYEGIASERFLNICNSIKVVDNTNGLTYYTDLFFLTNYEFKETKIISFFHLENKDEIPYYDFENLPQTIRCPLYFVSYKNETDEDIYKNDYLTPNEINVSRLSIYTYENWESTTTPYLHVNISRSMACDYFFINGNRYVFKSWDFDVDTDQKGFTVGNADGQLRRSIEDICNWSIDDFAYYTLDESTDTEDIYKHYINFLFTGGFADIDAFVFEISFNGIDFEELEVVQTARGKYTYVLDELLEHTIRIRIELGSISCENFFDYLIDYTDMTIPGTIVEISPTVTFPIPGWHEITPSNEGTFINGIFVPIMTGRASFCKGANAPFDVEGNNGGLTEVQILKANLPNINLTRDVGIETPAPGRALIWSNQAGGMRTEVTPLGGNDEPLQTMPPYIVVRKMIYAP